MKRTLTLMRHAKSSWEDEALPDHERPLNHRGEKAAKTMACRLKESGYVPNLVIVSSATRTQQTAEALNKCYNETLPIQSESLLYEADIERVVDVIRAVDKSVAHLMLVGHNPVTEMLADRLANRSYGMPTAAYIRFDIPVPWHDFTLDTYEVIAYDFPKSQK